MYKKYISWVLFALCCVVNAQQNSCMTPNGNQGQCILVNECKLLYDVLNKPNKAQQDIDLLKISHCGFEGRTPRVCCPLRPPSTNCYTPEEKPGQCVSINECPNLYSLLKPSIDIKHRQYVERSRCDGLYLNSVCCGPAPQFRIVQGDCETKLSAFPPDPATECCGLDSTFDNKIFGGNATTVDEYPWLALIEYVNKTGVFTLCGGALISSKYVLTAAHCVRGQAFKTLIPTNIRLAEYDTRNEGQDCAVTESGGIDCTEGVARIPIEKIIPHPDYKPAHVRHDIALIRMAHMAPFTEFIRPICLPSRDATRIPLPYNVTAAGWGAVSDSIRNSPVKLQVTLPFVDQARCQSAYTSPGRLANLWAGQICAGGEAGKDACKGDSGGPLMYQNGRTYEIIGVVSFGSKWCGQEDLPGVYTNVYQYSPWIRSNIVP